LRAWGDGFWGLNEFAMQMSRDRHQPILAASRPFRRLPRCAGRSPALGAGAIGMMALFSITTALFHTGACR
jgi:short subunit fatty acids transporter